MKEHFGPVVKAIVVEDEEKIGKYISHKITSLDSDVLVVGQAQNGKEALALIETCRPQIVFTDISMPVMDGLELARVIRNGYPGILVVIISGYSEFSYAQKAIQYGVFNYILKPIEDRELSDVLYDIKKSLVYDHLGHERQVVYSDKNMFWDARDAEYIIFSICVGNLIYDMKDPVLVQCYREQMQQLPWKRIMEETFGEDFSWYLADEEPVNQKIAGIKVKKGAEVSIRNLAEKLCRNIRRETGLVPHLSCPESTVLPEEVWNTTKYLRYRLQQKLVVGQTQIFMGEEESGSEKKVMEIVKMRLESDVKNYFRSMELKDLTGDIQNVLSYMVKNGMPQTNMEKVCQYVLKLLEVVDGYYDAEVLKDLKIKLQRGIGCAASEEELLQCMEDYSREINGYMNHVCEENMWERMIAYMDKNFLTLKNLKEAANALGYNYTYFSRLFKKVTGLSASQYITDKKISMAKELLSTEPGMALKDVGEKCGYYDTSYFIRIFKKWTGMSPGEYRGSVSGGG